MILIGNKYVIILYLVILINLSNNYHTTSFRLSNNYQYITSSPHNIYSDQTVMNLQQASLVRCLNSISYISSPKVSYCTHRQISFLLTLSAKVMNKVYSAASMNSLRYKLYCGNSVKVYRNDIYCSYSVNLFSALYKLRVCSDSSRKQIRTIHSTKLYMANERYCPDPSYPYPTTLLSIPANQMNNNTYNDIVSYNRMDSIIDIDRTKIRYYPPYVYHIIADKKWDSLIDMIRYETNISVSYIKELINFGAIYLEIPDDIDHSSKGYSTKNTTKYTKQSIVNNESLRKNRLLISDSIGIDDIVPEDHDESINPVKLSLRRISLNILHVTHNIAIGSYCRVHINPMRYYGGYRDWSHRVYRSKVLNNIVIVNKPYDLPMSANVDNILENVVSYVQQNIKSIVSQSIGGSMVDIDNHMIRDSNGSDEYDQLYVTSRLDVCTSGLSPIAQTKSTAALLSTEIANRNMKKYYRVLCCSPIPLPIGHIKHLYKKQSTAKHSKPTLLRQYEELYDSDTNNSIGSNDRVETEVYGKKRKGKSDKSTEDIWKLAELKILSCNLMDKSNINLSILSQCNNITDNIYKINKDSLSKDILQYISNMSNDINNKHYECEVELVTGRTHQIRLQFSALNAPIVGDTKYEPVRGLYDEGKHTMWGDGFLLFGPEPKVIGLQCYKLQFSSEFRNKLYIKGTYHNSNTESNKGYDDSTIRQSDNIIEGVRDKLYSNHTYHNSYTESHSDYVDINNRQRDNIVEEIRDNGDILYSVSLPWWRRS